MKETKTETPKAPEPAPVKKEEEKAPVIKKEESKNAEAPSPTVKRNSSEVLDAAVKKEFEASCRENSFILKFINPTDRLQKVSYVRAPDGVPIIIRFCLFMRAWTPASVLTSKAMLSGGGIPSSMKLTGAITALTVLSPAGTTSIRV